jgi:hypothetical protein
MTSVPGHVTPLRLSQRTSLGQVPGRPPSALVESDWLGASVASARPGTRRFLTDLTLPMRERSPQLTFKKAAYVDLGEIRQTPNGWELEIGWQSSSLAPLFPVFAGKLTVTATEVTLEGFYAPPGGEIGAALDKAFLNIAARGTARWFLERVIGALAAADAPAPAGAPATGSAETGNATA